MKYLLGVIVAVVIGVLVWPGVVITPTPVRAPAVAAAPESAARATRVGGTAASSASTTSVTPAVTPAATSAPPTRVPAVTGTTLLIPVQGVAAGALTDTFNDARSQGRSHDAIDIMAAAGTPVLAVADGHVEKLFTSERGGLAIYQFEPAGRTAYYYAHLQAYAPGLAEKQPIRRGQVIGYVGSTGNASPEAPHLHFAVFVLGPDKHWWEGDAVNPYPLLTSAAD